MPPSIAVTAAPAPLLAQAEGVALSSRDLGTHGAISSPATAMTVARLDPDRKSVLKRPLLDEAQGRRLRRHLDNAATPHVFDFDDPSCRPIEAAAEETCLIEGLGTRIAKGRATVEGLPGSVLMVKDFGRNLISFNILKATHRISMNLAERSGSDDQYEFIATPKDGGPTLKFTEAYDGLYDQEGVIVDPPGKTSRTALMATPAAQDLELKTPSNGTAVTKAAVRNAVLARRIHEARGHPGRDAELQMAKRSARITARDVENAETWLGPCPWCVVGKSVEAPAITRDDKSGKPGQFMAMDIFFVDKVPYLCMVCKTTQHVSGGEIGGGKRTVKQVFDAVVKALGPIVQTGHEVEQLESDSEPTFKAIADTLRYCGITPYFIGAGGHSAAPENMIKTLKARTRTLMASLPYPKECVPPKLRAHAVKYAMSTLNHTPRIELDWRTPIEVLRNGEFTPASTFEKMEEFTFGCLVSAVVPRNRVAGREATEPLAPRAITAIYLGAPSSGSGYRVLPLGTKRRVRTWRTCLPHEATDADLETMRAMVAESKHFVNDYDEAEVVWTLGDMLAAMDGPLGRGKKRKKKRSAITVVAGEGESKAEVEATIAAASAADGQASGASGDEGAGSDTDTPVLHSRSILELLDRAEREIDSRSKELQGAPKSVKLTNRALALLCQTSPAPPVAFTMTATRAYREDEEAAVKASEAEAKNLVEHDSLEPHDWSDRTAAEAALRAVTNFRWKTEQVLDKKDGRTIIKEVATHMKCRTCIDGRAEDVSQLSDDRKTAPTARSESVKLQLATAAAKGWEVGSCDIASAYLHSKMPEERLLYVRFDVAMTKALIAANPTWAKGVHLNSKGEGLFRIRKGVYGLVEAGSLWRESIVDTLASADYRPLTRDPCVFAHRNSNGDVDALVSTHVDDLLHTGSHKDRAALWEVLRQKYANITVKDGPTIKYVGLEITITDSEFVVTQQSAIDAIWEKYPEASTGRHVATPMGEGQTLLDDDRADYTAPEPDQRALASVTMELMYIATQVRADVAFPCMVLSTLIKKAKKTDLPHALRIIKYLHATRERGLHFRRARSPQEKAAPVVIEAEADASHLSHHDSKGTSGYLIYINGTLVLWRSRKQKVVTRSSTETELVSLNEVAPEVVWVVEWCEEVGLRHKDRSPPVHIRQDNMSTITLSAKGVGGTGKSRHMNSRLNYVKQIVEQGYATLVYTPSEELLADALTKAKGGEQFDSQARRMAFICTGTASCSNNDLDSDDDIDEDCE
jgi:hypothetical protein